MSLRGLYLAVQAQLQAEVPQLKLVDLYKNQFEDTQGDPTDMAMHPETGMSMGKQNPIPYPCVFILFPSDNPQTSAGAGVKQLEVLITIKIGYESYVYTPLDLFDLVDAVELALDGFSDNATFSRLTYVAQRVPQDVTMISVYEFDYKCTYQDTLCRRNRNDIIKIGSTLKVEVDIIEPPYTVSNDGTISSDN